MIKVDNSSFEIYRAELLSYAMGLLRQRGSGNVLHAEYDEKAKDIVQECYLAFHNSRKDIFVTENHLFNYLKICLFNCYRGSVWHKNRVVQYNLFKEGDLSVVPESTVKYNQNFYDDHGGKFIETLTDNQKDIVNKLLDGFTMSEIAADEKISRQAIHASLSYIKKRYIKYEDTSSKM
jgi:DNA-directed RNA polymerase specialized sigma24 family protein